MKKHYTEEESIWHARGMKARKSGIIWEEAIAERIPREMFGAWYAGWNRGGRQHLSGQHFRQSRLPRQIHVVDTEAQTLDEALDELAKRARYKKMVETRRARPKTLKELFQFDRNSRQLVSRAGKNQAKSKVTLPKLKFMEKIDV